MSDAVNPLELGPGSEAKRLYFTLELWKKWLKAANKESDERRKEQIRLASGESP